MAMDRTFFTAANIDILMKKILNGLADIIDVTVPTAAGTAFTAINTYFGVTTITAFATGGQANATVLTGEFNEITTCTTIGDSVKLPVAALGKKCTIINSGATAVDIFPVAGSSIGDMAVNAAYRLGQGLTVVFTANSATKWLYDCESSSEAANLVTQGTGVTTGVTANTPKGIITTFSQSAAAGVSSTFTVTCSAAAAASNIRAYVIDYAGIFTTNGLPVVSVDNRTAGSFDIVVSNAHGANALSGALKIGFEIVS
jgi:hypothetical protein